MRPRLTSPAVRSTRMQGIHSAHFCSFKHFWNLRWLVFGLFYIHLKYQTALINIPVPGSWLLSIPDQQQQQNMREENNVLSYLFCRFKFDKIENCFIYEQVKKKIWANSLGSIVLLTSKNVTKLSKIWVWVSGLEKTRFFFLKKPAQWVFWVFWVFLGFFWVFLPGREGF